MPNTKDWTGKSIPSEEPPTFAIITAPLLTACDHRQHSKVVFHFSFSSSATSRVCTHLWARMGMGSPNAIKVFVSYTNFISTIWIHFSGPDWSFSNLLQWVPFTSLRWCILILEIWDCKSSIKKSFKLLPTSLSFQWNLQFQLRISWLKCMYYYSIVPGRRRGTLGTACLAYLVWIWYRIKWITEPNSWDISLRKCTYFKTSFTSNVGFNVHLFKVDYSA